MIIGGSLSGEFGRTIDRDNQKETLHLEVFNLRRDVERIKFDHVCEFNALAADFDDQKYIFIRKFQPVQILAD